MHRATAALILTSLALVIAACHNAPSSTTEDDKTTVKSRVKTIDAPIQHFATERLRRVVDTRLPEAIERGKPGPIRRYCDIGARTVEQLHATTDNVDDDTQALFDTFERRCTIDVALAMIDQSIAKIERVDDPQQRIMACQTEGGVTVAYVKQYGNLNNTDLNDKLNTLLETCPSLAERLQRFEAERKRQERERQRK